MGYLVRFSLETKIAQDLGLQDSYQWHKKLWELFPGRPEAKRDFLTRIDTLERFYQVWILAKNEPRCPTWCHPESFAKKNIPASFLTRRFYAFDLRANPTRAVVQNSDGSQNTKRGKRIPLVKEEELRQWIERKGKVRCLDENNLEVPGGFKIVEEKPLEIRPMIESYFRKDTHAAYHGGVQFRGVLEVSDQASFVETYFKGIGSAKGFGFGLMLLAPVRISR